VDLELMDRIGHPVASFISAGLRRIASLPAVPVDLNGQ
jgi:hypothetical protein